jgi:hypothetical protein
MSVELEGFAALERELLRLSKSQGKASLRRSLKKAAKPMAELMIDAAPRGDGAEDGLAETIAVGTKLSKRQAKKHRKMFKDDRSAVEVFVGPGPDPAAWNQEFGNIIHGPQPFVRPSWDADHMPLLVRLGREVWNDLEKTLDRAARKAAKG